MENKEEKIIISLLDKDPELRKYYEEHQELEEKLLKFKDKLHLSTMEEIDKKQLQKLKLQGKDKIMKILVKHRQASVPRDT